MKSIFILLGALLLLPSSVEKPQESPTVTVVIGGDGLVIERPAVWKPGVMNGPSMLVHFIGGNDGFPQFSAMNDPGAAVEPDTPAADTRDAVEDMFREIASGDEVREAGWVTINGIEAHSSLATRNSPVGKITRRRLLFVHAGVPYVVVWAHHADRYSEIAEIVETCAASLRTGRGPGRIAGLEPAS
jgi:hypothetical protein